MDFIQLQQKIKERLKEDRSVRIINAEGPTIEAAVAQAATLLDIPVRRLEYEVLERGFPGFLGAGKKIWKISAYERARLEEDAGEEETFDEAFADGEAAEEDRDGDCFVQLTREGVMLKVTPPEGRGKRVSEARALTLVNSRPINNLDAALLATVVKQAKSSYVRVADFTRSPANDTSIEVELAEQDMKAWMRVTAPGPGGCDLSAEEYLSQIKANRIYYGLKEDYIRDFADRPVYREAVLVAEGIKPVNGRDAFIQYNFETVPNKVRMREGADGRVDFKQLNIIQNVVQGQPLARKVPAEEGVDGMSISGTLLPANDGRDIDLPLGVNVHVAEDGVTIVADINGQVVMSGDKINVEPSYIVQGNVGLKTGNIDFLGNVIINGNVEDGFSVKSAGNIEVNGMVERAQLEAEGDIIIHQGVTGKGSGAIRAGRSLWAKFIENSIVVAGNMVVVNDGIVNSHVDAFGRIVVQGKRANIVGGRLRASEEIMAKAIGSPISGTETICEVGYDLKAKLRFDQLSARSEELAEELEELEHNLQALINIKKQRKGLPDEKEQELRDMTQKRQAMIAETRALGYETAKLKEILDQNTVTGKISASDKVYSGVKIVIRDIREDVRNDFSAVSFSLENGLIRVNKYEEPGEELQRQIDANSTD
ncbi:MAG: FapA family protein [Spirochaetaceae bacterium]|nr:FapA family protein [Spirochaetaceae bacterium]